MNNLLYRQGYNFTKEDREACLPVIKEIIALANKARCDGILALEIEITTEQHPFLNLGISLIVDGTDPVLVRQILENLILSENHSEKELLKRLVMLEGLLQMQQGANPRIIETLITSLLGEELMGKFILDLNNLKEYHIAQADVVSDYHESEDYSKDFEKTFDCLSPRDLQLVLRFTDVDVAAAALKGCGSIQKQKLLRNVSMNTAAIVNDLWRADSFTKEYIIDSQDQIHRIVHMLTQTGELILMDREKLQP